MPTTEPFSLKSQGGLHQALALALLAFAFAAFILGLAMPVQSYLAGQRQALDTGRANLARYAAVAAGSAGTGAALEKAKAGASSGGFLSGTSEGGIAADLQSRIKAAFEEGVQVRSMRSLPARNAGGMRFLGARVEAAGTWRALQRALYQIETQTPVLFVSSLILRAPAGPDGQGIASETLIEMQFEASGVLPP